MRKFRNAALAGLTALSLVAGATTATAAEKPGSSASDLKSIFNAASDDQIWANYMTGADRLAFFEGGVKYLDDPSKIQDLANDANDPTKSDEEREEARTEYQKAMAAFNYFETWVVPQCQDAYDLEAQIEGQKKLEKLDPESQEYKDLNKKLYDSLAAKRLAELKKAAEKGEPGAMQRWANIEKLALTLHPNMKKFDPVDPNCETNPLFDDLKYASSNPKSGSAVFGKRYNAEKDVNAKDLVGSTKNFSRQPIWSQLWIVATAIGVIGSIIGLVFFPFMNQLKNQQVII